MHLVTGLFLTALLGRGRTRRYKRLPTFPGVVETTHALPGRLRFRVPALTGRPGEAAALADRLGRLDGVESAAASSVSGSVLVEFDPGQVESEMLLGAVIRLLGLEQQIERLPPSRVAREIRDLGQSVNRALHDRTGGLIDLWTALPLLLVAIGLRNVAARNGQLGWPLLWWAYLSLFPPGQNHQ